MSSENELKASRIARYLTRLTGRDIECTPRDAALEPRDGSLAAVYIDANDTVQAICLFDVGAAASLAGTSLLGGLSHVDAAIEAMQLDGMLLESFLDICNMFARGISDSVDDIRAERLTLSAVTANSSLTQNAAWFMDNASSRLDVKIVVRGLGGGCLALVTQ